MFPTARTPKLAQHAFGALRVARSFLLLEDGREVDWEVDASPQGKDELTPPAHPHRSLPGGEGQLRRRRPKRRPGTPVPTYHVCLSPVERRGTLHARVHATRAQESGGSARARGASAGVPGCTSPSRDASPSGDDGSPTGNASPDRDGLR
jgi:hypothetical protein